MPDFTTMDIATLTRGVSGEGVRYLELFLKEYTRVFKVKVNPSCRKCLQGYLINYKNHFKAMANTSQYRLHTKYENIPLQFGSPILVNNANITDEYAQILLQRPGGESLFAQTPQPGTAMRRMAVAEPATPAPPPDGLTDNEIEGYDDL